MAWGQDRDGAISGLRLPVVLGVVSLFVLMAFEVGEAIHDRGALSDLRSAQEPTVQEAIKLRQQLAQFVVFAGVCRKGPDQRLVDPAELNALIDELLALIDLRLHRVIVLHQYDVGDHQDQGYHRQRNQQALQPAFHLHSLCRFSRSASCGSDK